MGATKELAEFIASINYKDLPKEVINEAKLCFLDWLGVTLAGAHDPEINSLFEVIQLVGGNEQVKKLVCFVEWDVLENICN